MRGVGGIARSTIKATATAIGVLLVLPLVVPYRLAAALFQARRDILFQFFVQLLAPVPGLPGDYLRRTFLWLVCPKVSLRCSVGAGTIFANPDIEIGSNVYLGPMCSIGRAAIGQDTMLGTGVHLLGGGNTHGIDRLDIPMRLQERGSSMLRVGRDCWIGNGAIVMADVGDHSVVGAGSVVTRPVGAWKVVAGSPARVIRDRRDGGTGKPIAPPSES